MIKKIYLAHAVSEREEGKKIQAILEDNGFEVENPFYPKVARGDITDTDKGLVVPWTLTGKKEAERVVWRDLETLKKCDILLAVLPEGVTIGIPCEMMFAWMRGMRIYTITTKLKGHPWVLGLSDEVFDSIESFLHFWHNL